MKRKRKARKRPSPEPFPILSLPEDLVLNCLARVSRLYHPVLSLVSKSFRSLISSPKLYVTRSLLGLTESCLYVCLRPYPNSNPCWFTLCRKPNNRYHLVPIAISPPRSPQTSHCLAVVAVGSDIYSIGSNKKEKSSGEEEEAAVSILDCTSNTWREAPSVCLESYYPAAIVCYEGIYVIRVYSASDWTLVTDPIIQTWEHVLYPFDYYISKRATIEGKSYVFGQNGAAYNSKEDRIEATGLLHYLNLQQERNSYVVIDNVLYRDCESLGIQWYDSKGEYWKYVKGIHGLPSYYGLGCFRFVDYGGKMVVLWDDLLCYEMSPPSPCRDGEIFCAVIALERRNNEEIWGHFEWSGVVLTVSPPHSYQFVYALASTV
ncbi:hypothetical protein CARUB_v10025324mg [Capsella rubella]|uniref:F-box domain-containing protein n=1 Tax=Capsella rubella TaxID=81985 RepID=R0HYC8_9BRAS|nr:F-box/kelch-repeat protein At5g49000 [Capsella rubella]EOA29068.1 hypothetical protein CARUB_v10025324mg [Capsella rubella]